MSEDAVSPVVGTVLMVAIAVVLAGIVALMVAVFTDDTPPAPTGIVFVQDETADRMVLVSSSGPMSWGQYSLKAQQPLFFALNEAPSLGDDAVTATGTALPDVAATGGDYIAFCGLLGVQNVEILLLDRDANRIAATVTFAFIQAC